MQLTIDDFLANSYIKRHHGMYEPEVRLWMIWISDAFMIGGLVFLGVSLQDLLPWIATAFAWSIYVFGTVSFAQIYFLTLVYGNGCDYRVQSRCFPRSRSGSRCLDQHVPYSGWICRKLFPYFPRTDILI